MGSARHGPGPARPGATRLPCTPLHASINGVRVNLAVFTLTPFLGPENGVRVKYAVFTLTPFWSGIVVAAQRFGQRLNKVFEVFDFTKVFIDRSKADIGHL